MKLYTFTLAREADNPNRPRISLSNNVLIWDRPNGAAGSVIYCKDARRQFEVIETREVVAAKFGIELV